VSDLFFAAWNLIDSLGELPWACWALANPLF